MHLGVINLLCCIYFHIFILISAWSNVDLSNQLTLSLLAAM